jgi:large subunit ribosomal protein L21
MAYAIISLGGKQYRVQEGEKLFVDRLRTDEGKTLEPRVLFLGGDGEAQLAPEGVTVTARVVRHVLGEKIRIGKYKPKKGYKKHIGYRSKLSQIEIEAIGKGRARATPKPKAEAAKPAEAEQPKAAAKPVDAPKGMPSGYAEMTVAEVSAGAKEWNRPMLEAALEYERAHADRKGAVSALESALKKKEEG